MAKDTLFTSDAQASGASGEYVKDAFSDVSLPANSNSGLTSTALTNPFSKFFGNSDSPQFSAKTMLVKDLEILPSSQWISNKPTYKIIFTEEFPEVFAYAFGNVRLRNSINGISIEARSADDGFGISGKMLRAAWLTNITSATGTADIVTDGVDTGADITFGGADTATETKGVDKFNMLVHQAADATDDLHDFRITANEAATLSLVGILAYASNAAIEARPGITYIDKTKYTSVSGATLPIATPEANGGAHRIYKTIGNGYTLSTSQISSLLTTGTGSSGTNLLNVATGAGASFKQGYGIVANSGTSMYFGDIRSVSTDTLTMGVTLPFAIGGSLYRAWYSSSTAAISATYFVKSFDFDPGNANVDVDTNGFGVNFTGDMYYSDLQKRYRVWGKGLRFGNPDGNFGVGALGATTGFLQIEGRFGAAEIEIAGASGLMHFTCAVNGCVQWGINESVNGRAKKTLITDSGSQWNIINLGFGTSFAAESTITKINFYEHKHYGQTLGSLAEYNTNQTQVERAAINVSLMHLGTYKRSFADELYFTGATTGSWVRGTTATSSGGVFYGATLGTALMNFQYYGKDFGVIGTAGTSVAMTLDGASISPTFNVMKSVATLGFHSIQLLTKTGNTIVEAVDFVKPRGEISNLQKFAPRDELDDAGQIIESINTPLNPKPGTVWAQKRSDGIVWIYLFNRWNRLAITQASDDPNALGLILIFGGSTT